MRISEIYKTKALFFLQPDAVYNYPEDLYRLQLPDSFLKSRTLRQHFYDQMKARDGFIDFTGLFAMWGRNRKAIVDDVHYSPSFNHFLAEHVARHINLASLANGSSDSVDSEGTGAPRRTGMAPKANSK